MLGRGAAVIWAAVAAAYSDFLSKLMLNWLGEEAAEALGGNGGSGGDEALVVSS